MYLYGILSQRGFMKKIFTTAFVCLFTLITILTLAGCSAKEKTYESTSGISITLTDNFVEKEYITATYYLQSENAIFIAVKENFDDLSYYTSVNSESSLIDYANVVISGNLLTSTIKYQENLTYFTYNKSVSEKSFYYLAVVVKGTDAFWLCQFCCLDSTKEVYEQKFLEWAKTIVVD